MNVLLSRKLPVSGAELKVISCNVNGIRSAAKKGFWEWLGRQNADFICLQEVRAKEDQIPKLPGSLANYHVFNSFAEKPGYSGVMILSRHEVDSYEDEIGFDEMDREGRFIQVNMGGLSVASIYFPSGSAKESRQEVKYEFMDHFLEKYKKEVKKKRQYILCGDYNIAHKNIDIKNWRSNQKNSGFLPEEREWMDRLFDEIGYVDAFRIINQEEQQYTWWSNRGNAYANNTGWRIDYQVISPKLKDKVLATTIYKDEKFSDHAPIIMEYDCTFG